MIDVIIPVFRGLAATRRCIDSVLAARCSTPHEVIAIDDRSPEPEISAWLSSLAASGRVTLIAHAANRGFVASVNEGMALHADRDVVLLNSDTEVADGWLDRIAACAAKNHAGTVTPFSSNATICSYPRFCAKNVIPEGWTTASLDRLFARENEGGAVEIPTAVGFCMFISRRLLDAIGAFDVETFGQGYGEEVDFCMRARRAGYRNYLCADTFVFHEGEVSFGNSGMDRRARAQKIVDTRYPEFQPTLAEFLKREPARPFRRRVDIARLAASPRPRVLLVAHSRRDKDEKRIHAAAAALARDSEVLVLRADGGNDIALEWLREGEEFEARFDSASAWHDCIALLRSLGVARVQMGDGDALSAPMRSLAQALGAS